MVTSASCRIDRETFYLKTLSEYGFNLYLFFVINITRDVFLVAVVS